MKYKIYYKQSKCNSLFKDSKCIWNMGGRKTWPKDTTELYLEMDGYDLYYKLSNLSDRTQYLFEEGKLGIGIFVEENPSWISKKEWWRSDLAKENHLTRRCIKVCKVNNLSGTIDLSDRSSSFYGALSRQLYYPFRISGDYQDPYKEEGTENIAIGIGRMYTIDEDSYAISCFRPYNVSDYMEITVSNNY